MHCKQCLHWSNVKACHRNLHKVISGVWKKAWWDFPLFLVPRGIGFPEQLGPGLAVRRQLLSKASGANRDVYASEMSYERPTRLLRMA